MTRGKHKAQERQKNAWADPLWVNRPTCQHLKCSFGWQENQQGIVGSLWKKDSLSWNHGYGILKVLSWKHCHEDKEDSFFFFHNYSQNFIDKLLSEKYFSGNLLLRIEKLLVLISESPSVWALATRLCRCPALGISEEIITENGRLKIGRLQSRDNK